MSFLRRTAPSIFLCALLLSVFSVGLSKSYVLERVEQDVFFRADGTVRIEDTRILRLEGDFSENTYFVEIDPAKGGSVRFEGVQALDGKTPAVADINGNEIAWKVRAQDETRRFRFSYVLTGEMKIAEDVAQFDRQVLEPEHVPVEAYVLRLHPPAPSPEQFRVFIFTGRGRIGTLEIAEDASLATVTLDELSENEFVRSRVLLDAGLFNVQTIEGERLDIWLQEIRQETEGFRDASQQAIDEADSDAADSPNPFSLFWVVLLWLLVILIALFLWRNYQKYGREPQTPEVGPYWREPAEEVPPAVVPFILSQSDPGIKAAGPAIAATLLDFARRGVLKLETVSSDGFLGIGSSENVYYQLVSEPKDVPAFEADLWNAFEGAALQADKISLVGLFQAFQGADKAPTASNRVFDADDLRTYFESHASFAQSWVKKPRAWYERTHGKLLDEASSLQAPPIALLCFLAALGSGTLAFFILERATFLGLNLFAAAAVLVGLGITAAVSLKRWNAAKLLNAERWQAYRRFLSDFSVMEEAPAEHYKLWDYHFIYATALGVSKQYLKNLRKLMRQHPDSFYMPLWLGATHANMAAGSLAGLEQMTANLNTLSQLQTNLDNLESALAPQTKTGGGFGGSSGGFSGGSSGGGGSSGMR